MTRLAKILSAAVLSGAVLAAIGPASAQQQTSVQPFVPYNGTNGAGPLNPAAGPPVQNPNAPGATAYPGLGYIGAYRGNTNYNAACDPHSQYYNPTACR
jgi:hypothetical protein